MLMLLSVHVTSVLFFTIAVRPDFDYDGLLLETGVIHALTLVACSYALETSIARSSSVQNIVMAVPQKAAPLPVTNDSEEMHSSRNPVGLQVSKPDPPSRNLVRDTNQPFQGLTSNSTPPQGSEDAEPLLHNEREHQEAIQQRLSEFEMRMHKFDENMKELKETIKKLEEELHVKEVKEDRRVSKLKSKVAALEKRIAPDGGTEIGDMGCHYMGCRLCQNSYFSEHI